MAFSGCVVPSANDGFAGVIASDTSVGCTTLRVADPLIVPEAAVMVALPCPVPVARPELVTLAMVREDEVQVTELARFCVLPSV